MAVKDIFDTYIQELHTRYEKKCAAKVLIAKTGFLVHPILKEMGLGNFGSVALVTDTVRASEMVMYDLVGIFGYSMFPICILPKEIKRILSNAEYELLGFTFIKGSNSINNLEMLQAACQTGNISGHEFTVMPIVFFSGGIPDAAKDLLAGQIIIQPKEEAKLPSFYNNNSGSEFSKMIIEFVSSNWSAIKMEINRLTGNSDFRNAVNDTPGVGMYFVAEKLLELLLETGVCTIDEREKYVLEYRNALADIIKEWQISSDSKLWVEVLGNMIRNANTKLPVILDRNNVMASNIANIEESPFYDNQFYYLPTKLLDEFCKPLIESISIKQIKELLAEEGILIGEGRGRKYLTVKVPVVTEYGAILKPRRIRLSREWLDPVGELTWKEMLEANAESEEE